METEEKIKETVFKIHAFDEFPYKRMREVLDTIESLGFEISLIDNGNIVCQDINKIKMEITETEQQKNCEKYNRCVECPEVNCGARE